MCRPRVDSARAIKIFHRHLPRVFYSPLSQRERVRGNGGLPGRADRGRAGDDRAVDSKTSATETDGNLEAASSAGRRRWVTWTPIRRVGGGQDSRGRTLGPPAGMSLDRRPSLGCARALLMGEDPNAPRGTCRTCQPAVFDREFHRCTSVASRWHLAVKRSIGPISLCFSASRHDSLVSPPRRRFFRSRPRRLVRVIRASRTERTRRDAVEAQTASTHAHGGTWSVAVAPGGGRRVIVTRAGDAGSPDSESKDDSSREVRFAPDDRRSSDTDDVAPSRVRPRVGHV